GLTKKSDYRRFLIRDRPGDDVASIAEVVRRRFSRDATASESDDSAPASPSAGIDPDTGRPRRFAYPPQLLVVDGGAAQASAAQQQLTELGITDITVCGLAKRLEEVWLPDQADPL